MDNTKNDEYYVEKMINDFSFVIKHMQGIDLTAFASNEVLQDSTLIPCK